MFAFYLRLQTVSSCALEFCVNGVGKVRIERLTSIFAAPEVQRLEPDIKPESILLTCPSVVILDSTCCSPEYTMPIYNTIL
jgi:hypothetical protein